MNKRSAFDRLHREQAGQWVRLPDDMSSTAQTDSNKMFLVTVDVDSMSRGPGDWVPVERPGYRYHSGSLGTTAGVADIWILSNDHHTDMEDTAGADDVDWPFLPGEAVFTAYYTSETWNPADAQDDDYGNPPAWNDTETNYGNGGGEIDVVIHDGFYWTALSTDIPADSEPTDASIYWEKGEANASDKVRPVYRIDPLPPGPIPGYVTGSVSAASNQGGDTPTMSSATFQTYIKDSGGSWGNGPLLAGVQYNLEEALTAGTLGLVTWGYSGFWLMPSCAVGSSYSA